MIICSDARLIPLADATVQCVVTSPPYWGLRDYGIAGQLGLEKTPLEYVENMVTVFQEVKRVLRADGLLWLNLGDSYNGSGKKEMQINSPKQMTNRGGNIQRGTDCQELKPKDLVGIPWRVAFALQADGWYLRSDIIWSKPNPMPESVTDRPTKAHEYIFLMAKGERYFYDADAISQPASPASIERLGQSTLSEQAGSVRANGGGKTNGPMRAVFGGRNKHEGYGNRRASGREDEGNYLSNGVNCRTVWEIATQPYKGSHFATFPEKLAERCIKAGSRPGDLVLDPFGGSGTVGRVAEKLNRRWVCADLNYHDQAAVRTSQVQKELLEVRA